MSLVKAFVLLAVMSCFESEDSCVNVNEISIDQNLPPVMQEGLASYYGSGKASEKGMHGKITATGEIFDPKQLTCASRNIPLNTLVIVENTENGKKVICRVNDRGPYGAKLHDNTWAAMFFKKGHYFIRRKTPEGWLPEEKFKTKPGKYRGIMDLSLGTAKALDFDLNKGMMKIRVRYLHF